MPITPANRIVAQSVSWLWPGRIPLGKLTLLDGNPDLGKSLLALDWCARLSSGRPFPDCETAIGPARALVLSAEDAERAKKALGVRSQREYRQGEPVTYWLLEDQELGAEHYDNYVVDQMIRKLRAGLPGTGETRKHTNHRKEEKKRIKQDGGAGPAR